MTAKDIEGSLGYAVWRDDGQAVRRLLEAGHDVDDDAWGDGDKTPLMESLDEVEAFYDEGRRAMTFDLLAHGADVHRRDRGGLTPLHYAAGSGAAGVELLVRAGAELNAQAADGRTPLHIAVSRGSLPAVEALRRAGADPTLLDTEGRTASDLLPQDPESDDVEEIVIRGLLKSDAK